MRHLSVRRHLGLAATGAVLLALVVPVATGSSEALAQASSVTISPAQGPPGTEVTATGSGWTPGDTIQARWNTLNGATVGSATVNNSGGFTLPFAVPSGTAPVPYVVSFLDAHTNSFENANFTVTQSPPPPLTAPANVKVVPYGALDFHITWTSNSTSQTGFQVYNGVTTQNVTTATQDDYLWAVSQPGTYMCFAVRAYNSSGYSAWAGMWTCGSTPPSGSPAAPADVVATGVSPNAIQISFVNQADNETAFLFYNGVTTETYNSYNEPGQGSSFTYDWTGLQPNTWMCFEVAAYNQWGRSAYVPSTWACAWTQS
jgi:hypothetical protein